MYRPKQDGAMLSSSRIDVKCPLCPGQYRWVSRTLWVAWSLEAEA